MKSGRMGEFISVTLINADIRVVYYKRKTPEEYARNGRERKEKEFMSEE